MAIGPDKLTKKFQEEVDSFEQILDSRLALHPFGIQRINAISIPEGMTEAHFIILKERYLAVGWEKLTWMDDSRDGDYIAFQRKTTDLH